MIVTAIILEYFYIWAICYYSLITWTYKHAQPYQVRSLEDDRTMMLFYMHEFGVHDKTHLYDLGIRPLTIRKFYKAEKAKYLHDSTPLADKPTLRIDHRRHRVELYDTTMCQEKIECERSVVDWFYHRNG